MKEVKLSLPVRPWVVPNYITLEGGASIAIKDVPRQVIDAQIARWVFDVRRQASLPADGIDDETRKAIITLHKMGRSLYAIAAELNVTEASADRIICALL